MYPLFNLAPNFKSDLNGCNPRRGRVGAYQTLYMGSWRYIYSGSSCSCSTNHSLLKYLCAIAHTDIHFQWLFSVWRYLSFSNRSIASTFSLRRNRYNCGLNYSCQLIVLLRIPSAIVSLLFRFILLIVLTLQQCSLYFDHLSRISPFCYRLSPIRLRKFFHLLYKEKEIKTRIKNKLILWIWKKNFLLWP